MAHGAALALIHSSLVAYAPRLAPNVPSYARRACDARAAPNPSDDSQLFESLIESCGAASMVSLRRSEMGRSLVASQDVEAGDVLMTIPNNVLLTAHRSGVIRGLIGQTELVEEEVGDLRLEVGEEMFSKGATWDVRLAVAVLEATNGAGGPFWNDYRRLLPLPRGLRSMYSSPLALPLSPSSLPASLLPSYSESPSGCESESDRLLSLPSLRARRRRG